MKKILISFATNPKWYRCQDILVDSAKRYKLDGFINYTDRSKECDFAKKYENVNTVRGFGYWQWKPKIILDAMNQVSYGDAVLYTDSGSVIIHDLDYIFNKCNETGIVLFENRDGNYMGEVHKNRTWTKRDCFVLMGCDNEKYHEAPQIDAAYQMYKKTDNTLKFLEEYDSYCSNENIISDLPNITESNLPGFKDHRHDQSVLSLMATKYNISLLPEPSEWGNHINSRPYPQLFHHHRGVI